MTALVPGWPVAFRGSLAVAAGLTTWADCAGPGSYDCSPTSTAPSGTSRPTFVGRLSAGRGPRRARGLLGSGPARRRLRPAPRRPGRGHGHAGGGRRILDGLLVRRDRIAAGETTRVGDVCCTSPLRTAYDLGRQDDLVEGVVAVDRPAKQHRFDPNLLLHFAARYCGNPGTARLCAALAHANPFAGSPWRPASG